MILPIRFITLLFAVAAILVSLPAQAEEGEGKVKLGLIYEYSNYTVTHKTTARYGDKYGILAAYETPFASDYWFSADAKLLRGAQKGINGWRNSFDTVLRSNLLFGKIFETEAVKITPFTGLGFNHHTIDFSGAKTQDTNDFIIPLGVKLEKDTTIGLWGTDVRGEYVLFRERSGQGGAKSDWFDGSYNFDLGVYYEPSAIPIGFRPYVRYEKHVDNHEARTLQEREVVSGGLETYYHF